MNTEPNVPLLEALRRLNEDTALSDLDEDQTADVLSALAEVRAKLNPERTSLRRRPFEAPAQISSRGNERFRAGEYNPVVPQLDLRFEAETVWCEWEAGALDEGPPGFLHGGLSAYILDVLSGVLVQSRGTRAVTGTLNLRYHRAVPLHEPLMMQAHVDRIEGRKIFVTGTISFDGRKAVESQGLFIEITPNSHLVASALKPVE